MTKRGEIWSCCEGWRYGESCTCWPHIVEFFDATGAEVLPKAEGPRPSDRRAP